MVDSNTVVDSQQNTIKKHTPCPASMFYSTLILMFAEEPKCFLVDSVQEYRKPVLLDMASKPIEYQDLAHRGLYTIIFEETKKTQFENHPVSGRPYPLVESIAYSNSQ